MLWRKRCPLCNGLLQGLFERVGQWQRHDGNAFVDQLFRFFRRGVAANVTRLGFAVMHLAGFFREAVTHVFGVGHDLAHPQYGRTAAAKLARYQRMMARRKPAKGQPASGGYRTAKKAAAKQHAHVAAQRADTGRKWAKRIAADFDRIAVEDFRPRFLAKSTMARKAADGAIAATKRALIEQAGKHGRELVLVDPKHTTTDCSMCGARAKHRLPLSQRTYQCETCGYVAPRDKNSAQVIYNRAGFNPAGADGIRPERSPSEQAA